MPSTVIKLSFGIEINCVSKSNGRCKQSKSEVAQWFIFVEKLKNGLFLDVGNQLSVMLSDGIFLTKVSTSLGLVDGLTGLLISQLKVN